MMPSPRETSHALRRQPRTFIVRATDGVSMHPALTYKTANRGRAERRRERYERDGHAVRMEVVLKS